MTAAARTAARSKGAFRPSRATVAFVALMALALLVRLAFVAGTPEYRPDHDDRNYDWLARSIATTGAYPLVIAADGPRPIAFRPPAYPYALGGVYRLSGQHVDPGPERWQLARRVQAVLGALTAGLVGLLAWRLWGRRVGLVALGLAALYPPLVLVQGSLVSEALFVPLVLGAVLAAVQQRRSASGLRWAVACGGLAGLAILTRSNAPVLLLPLALAVWTGRPRWSRAALAAPATVILVAVTSVLPWTARNVVVLDEWVPLTTQTGPALAGTYNDVSRSDPNNPWAWRLLRHVPEYHDLLRVRREITEAEMDRRMRARVTAYLSGHPEYVAAAGYWNLMRLLELTSPQRRRSAAGTIGIRPSHADLSTRAFHVVALLALLGLVTTAARRTPAWLWLVPVMLVASVVFVNTETPRFRIPVDPWVIMLAALAIVAVWDRARHTRETA